MVTSGNSRLSIPTFIPLTDAARKYRLTEDVLTRLIRDGRIEAAQLPSGDLLVSDQDLNEAKTKEEIIEDKFGHLQRRPITISEASIKYKVPGRTIREWVTNDYVGVVNSDNYPMRVDEADVAYCAEIYHERKASGGRTGVPLLDESGLPYQLKHPQLSEYRRRRKKQEIGRK